MSNILLCKSKELIDVSTLQVKRVIDGSYGRQPRSLQRGEFGPQVTLIGPTKPCDIFTCHSNEVLAFNKFVSNLIRMIAQTTMMTIITIENVFFLSNSLIFNVSNTITNMKAMMVPFSMMLMTIIIEKAFLLPTL